MIERQTNSIKTNKDMRVNKAKRFLTNAENLVGIFADAITYSFWISEVKIPSEFKKCKQEAKVKGVDVSEWCIEDKWAYIILNGGYIIIVDGKKTYNLDMKKLRKGWSYLISEYPQTYANIMQENSDMIDHDTLIQLSLFGKLIYG